MMDMSSTFAKTRAKLRAYQVDFRSTGTDVDPFAVGALDTAGCDVNVGNVVLDGYCRNAKRYYGVCAR